MVYLGYQWLTLVIKTLSRKITNVSITIYLFVNLGLRIYRGVAEKIIFTTAKKFPPSRANRRIEMGRLTCWTSLVVLAVFLFNLQPSEACSCLYQHPQTKYCESHFVAVVTVEELSKPKMGDHVIGYKVNVSQIFKATPSAQIALEQKPLWLWTALQPGLCGLLTPKPGETWVLSGKIYSGRPHLSYCGLAMLWSNVTPLQRDNFREFYQPGCVCEISDDFFDSETNRTCIWQNSFRERDCEERYGTCMLGSTGCSWIHTGDYNKCMMKYQLERQH